jgi:hypothetical protein
LWTNISWFVTRATIWFEANGEERKRVLPEQRISNELTALLEKLKCGSKAFISGIGLDIETGRSIRPEAAKFFLDETEQASIQDPKALLRLWTVKEAIFKADPDNNEKILGDYILENPSEWSGSAYPRGREFVRFRYSSVQIDDGFLSIAILTNGERDV